MEFDIFKLLIFIVLMIVYLVVRKLFKKFADFTERLGNPTNSSEEMAEELKRLNTKVITLEQKINNKP
ncbi:hypothetical protein [Chryseobacterium sp. MMS23-Vi53]|uniref:hypothetical protein n=1 Tax=Chryseobacterium sp. MMS23-Vi53 TaxID=3386644 RepID=UPI0039E919B8